MSGKSLVILCGAVVTDPKQGREGEASVYLNVPRWRKDESAPDGGVWERNPILVNVHGPNAAKAMALVKGDRIFLTGETDMLAWTERNADGDDVDRRKLCVRCYRYFPGMDTDINQVMLVGRLGKDAEVVAGGGIVRFGVAVDRWHKPDGEEGGNVTVWNNVELVGKRTEAGARYLTKGKGVVIEGFLESRNYEDKRLGKKVWNTSIKTFGFDFAPGGSGKSASNRFDDGEFNDGPGADDYGSQHEPPTPGPSAADRLEEEIPF